jgi:hypothetical protein
LLNSTLIRYSWRRKRTSSDPHWCKPGSITMKCFCK